MTTPTQWSIRRLLLWVFIAALIASHLANLFQRRDVSFSDFTLQESEIVSSLAELDPTVEKMSSGGGSTQMTNSVEAEYNFSVLTQSASSFQIVDHVRRLFNQRIKDNGWEINGLGEGTEGFSFHLSKNDTKFMIYCWVIPTESDSYLDQKEREGLNATTLKILQIGYIPK